MRQRPRAGCQAKRMESVQEIKEALSARSRTATLDELRSEGRKRVRLVRAEHIAAMISEAVNTAIEHSGLVGPDEVERLVTKSRHEFQSILQQREQEQRTAQATEQTLEERESELEALRAQFEELQQSLAQTQQALAAAKAAPAAPAGAPTELLMSMMQEMATMKANLLHQQQAPTPAAPAGADLTSAIEKLTGSLNDRIEKLGKKMGVSAAVDSDAPLDLGGLFKDTGKELESNMQNIEVKQQSGGGIAANLARLKKLKGGG
jgi:chromosome segregation ATPase